MRVTVAICTWNRARLLDRTLQCMCDLSIPSDVEWDLLVVNNNSPDNTAEVLARYQERLPLRVVLETRQGTSFARNTAVREARGDYLVCADDDILVPEDWLAAYVAVFQTHPDASFFGGAVVPLFEQEPEPWYKVAMQVPAVSVTLAAVDHGPDVVPLAHDRLPYGANMAFRRDALPESPFDPRLGPRGNTLTAGEENVLLAELLDAGAQGWWVPNAAVQHIITPDRITVDYLRRFWYGRGMSDAVAYGALGRWRVLGAPGWLWANAIVGELRYQVGRWVASPDKWAKDLRLAASSRGRLRGVMSARNR